MTTDVLYMVVALGPPLILLALAIRERRRAAAPPELVLGSASPEPGDG